MLFRYFLYLISPEYAQECVLISTYTICMSIIFQNNWHKTKINIYSTYFLSYFKQTRLSFDQLPQLIWLILLFEFSFGQWFVWCFASCSTGFNMFISINETISGNFLCVSMQIKLNFSIYWFKKWYAKNSPTNPPTMEILNHFHAQNFLLMIPMCLNVSKTCAYYRHL